MKSALFMHITQCGMVIPTCPIFKGTDRLFCNIGKEVPLCNITEEHRYNLHRCGSPEITRANSFFSGMTACFRPWPLQ